MTPRERFLAAFDGGADLDRVPMFDVTNNPALFVRALGRDNFYTEGVPMVQLARTLGLDACLVYAEGYTGVISRRQNWLDDRHFVDDLGVRYLVNETSWPIALPQETSIRDRQTWEQIVLPDPAAPWRYEQIRQAVHDAHRCRADDVAVVAGVRMVFAVMWISMGAENLSLMLYDDPELISEMSDRLCRFWTEAALRAVEAGADAIFIASDMGGNGQTLVSPNSLRQFFLPHLKKQVQAIRQTGTKVILHSCGNINAILPDLVDAGIDGLNNLQIAAGMDIAQVKRDYGDRLTLMGNVDATHVLPSGNAASIEAAVIKTIAAASPGGRHLLASDHSLHAGIPVENIDLFLSAAGEMEHLHPLCLPEA